MKAFLNVCKTAEIFQLSDYYLYLYKFSAISNKNAVADIQGERNCSINTSVVKNFQV